MKTKKISLNVMIAAAFTLLVVQHAVCVSPEKTYKIAVIGFQDDYLTSNYYMTDFIAEKSGIVEDSINVYFNEALLQNLRNNPKSSVEFMPVEKNPKLLRDFYQYALNNSPDDKKSNNASSELFTKLLKELNADGILFINQYEINRLGDPFNTNFHIINYNIFSVNGELIHTSNASFESAELVPLNQLNGKYKKATQKIAKQTERILAKM